MNEILESLTARKSVRAYTDRPVTEEVRRAILSAAAQAPTAGNQQLYTILDITDPACKARLAESCDHQPFIAEAPVVLIFLADAKKWYDGFYAAGLSPRKPGPGELMLAAADALIAAQNAVVAAEALGLGSCYIGDIMENCELHRELLHLPKYVFPAAMLVMGYPTEQQAARKKPARVAMRHIVHENAYRTMDAAELAEMWTPGCGALPYEEWMRRFCLRKYDSDFSREMSRSVREYWKDYE